jgi:dihydropteroate synthase
MPRRFVMGVLNVTPDSFFDGGRYLDPSAAIERGRQLIAEGADIVDVGGESSRPGAEPVDEDEELRRVLPVIAALSREVRVSVDTAKELVARAAIGAGATLVNDVSGRLAAVAGECHVGYVAMHCQGTPATMQEAPSYDDVVAEVRAALRSAAAHAKAVGVEECYVDPGIGFGKTVRHNLELLGALDALCSDGTDVLVGTSRKRFLGALLVPPGHRPRPTEERLEGSIASAIYCLAAGAAGVRVHDVAATVAGLHLVGREPGMSADLEVGA